MSKQEGEAVYHMCVSFECVSHPMSVSSSVPLLSRLSLRLWGQLSVLTLTMCSRRVDLKTEGGSGRQHHPHRKSFSLLHADK